VQEAGRARREAPVVTHPRYSKGSSSAISARRGASRSRSE
jgi:hypothetical protein